MRRPRSADVVFDPPEPLPPCHGSLVVRPRLGCLASVGMGLVPGVRVRLGRNRLLGGGLGGSGGRSRVGRGGEDDLWDVLCHLGDGFRLPLRFEIRNSACECVALG